MSGTEQAPAPPAEVLGKMMKGFDSFEQVLKDGARVRREKEESRIHELRQQVNAVEAAVKAENEQRLEAAKALQAWTETQVIALRTRLEELLAARHADTVGKIAALTAKVAALEAKFEADKQATLEEVDRRNRELVAALNAFKADFEAERVSRAVREQKILDRIGAAEHRTTAQWNEERGVREQVYMGLKTRVEEAVDARNKDDTRFQNAAFTELAGIKNALESEARAREAEDEAMAGQINAYVAKLQASLAVINTDDDRF